MCYHVSNIASQNELEKSFDASLLYPSLYRPKLHINGFTEANVSIITPSFRNKISIGIWGLLPPNYQSDWIDFQNAKNSLNIKKQQAKSWLHNSLKYEPCLILLTGFYTFSLDEGLIKSYLVELETKRPFAVAGIYSVLKDGFISCAMVTQTPANTFIDANIAESIPFILEANEYKPWLLRNTSSIFTKRPSTSSLLDSLRTTNYPVENLRMVNHLMETNS